MIGKPVADYYEPVNDWAKRCFRDYPKAIIINISDTGQLFCANPGCVYEPPAEYQRTFAYGFKCWSNEVKEKPCQSVQMPLS